MEIDLVVKKVKDIFTHNFKDYHNMFLIIDKYLVPTKPEKKPC